jgi:hypothetical protein
MTDLDFDDAMARSTDERTFSNGSEYEMWSANWCGTCTRDVDGDCPLVSVALLERKPAEWIAQPRDQYPYNAYHCTAYQSEGEPHEPSAVAGQ